MLAAATDRFERRLSEEIGQVRLEMRDGFAALRKELAEQRVELLRWSFLFWLGQVAAMAAMFSVMLRAVQP